MEDEGFVDDGFIEETAWEYVGLHGKRSASVLRQLADIAERAGMSCRRRHGGLSPKPPNGSAGIDAGGVPVSLRQRVLGGNRTGVAAVRRR
jgi:hypothetical protein